MKPRVSEWVCDASLLSKAALALRMLVLALASSCRTGAGDSVPKFFVCRETLTVVVGGVPHPHSPPYPCWVGQSWQEAAYTCPPSRQLSF